MENTFTDADASSTWIVIPAYNEASRLPHVLTDVVAHHKGPIVVVDDGSTDDTARVARRPGVVVLRHLVNRGQGAALQTGIDFATEQGATYLVTFDADGQHCATDLPKLLEPLRSKRADLVLGSRFLGSAENIPRLRRFVLWLAVWFTRITTRLPLTDTHNGLRAFPVGSRSKLQLSEDGMAHASEILRSASRHRLRVVEVPVTIRYTTESLAKGQSTSAAFRILARMLVRRLLT